MRRHLFIRTLTVHLLNVLLNVLLMVHGMTVQATAAWALNGSSSDAVDEAWSLTQIERRRESVQAPQLKSPPTLALDGDPLIGRYGLSAQDVLRELAPHLQASQVMLTRSEERGTTLHEYYELRYGGWPIANAYLHLHHFENRLVMMRALLPESTLPAEPLTESDWLPLAELGFGEQANTRQSARQVLAESGGHLVPSWELTYQNTQTGAAAVQLIDAQSGTVLSAHRAIFDIALVYPRGPSDGTLQEVTLPDLAGTGYLDGRHIVVYAPGPQDPRVHATDGHFRFKPEDSANTLEFDQVQAYYGATRVLQWFKRRFGFDPGPQPIIVSVGDTINGRTDAAAYVPPPLGPAVRLGAGSSTLTNLARDTDVIAHEISHHLIFRYVTSPHGESGMLHEGFADYFAYAHSGDPSLGRSVVPGAPYLRTAALPQGTRFDDLGEPVARHEGGQLWSALLWDLRLAFGESMDLLVYHALAYLGPNSGLRDAFLALLNADRDLHPVAPDQPEHGIYGAHRCTILRTGLTRGFALFLEELDGTVCGLDLAAAAADSRAKKQLKTKGKGVTFSMFGKTCSIVGGSDQAFGFGPSWLMLIPLLLAFARTGVRGARQRASSRGHHGS